MINKKLREKLNHYPWKQGCVGETIGVRHESDIYYLCPYCETLRYRPWGEFKDHCLAVYCPCSYPNRNPMHAIATFQGDVLDFN